MSVDLDHDGAGLLVTRLKSDAKLRTGDRVRVGVVSYSVLAESSTNSRISKSVPPAVAGGCAVQASVKDGTNPPATAGGTDFDIRGRHFIEGSAL